MKIKYLLSCSLLAGSALFASCTSIEPKLDNDYKPLLPEEIPEGTITQLNYGCISIPASPTIGFSRS